MTKKELRKVYMSRRDALTNEEYLSLNEKICETFFNFVDLSNTKVIHTFLPMIRKKEVDTMMIISRLPVSFPEIRIVIPKMKGDELENFYYEGPGQLIITSWGIQEPRYGTPVNNLDIDLVIVPLLAYDITGHRVGYGKGFYDKLLSQCRNDCQKIGVSMFEPEKKIDNISENDFKLNSVVTPTGALLFH